MAVYKSTDTLAYGTVTGVGHSGQTVTFIRSYAITTAMIDNANDVIFIAGGIGVTPLLSMARQMARNKAETGQGHFRFYYCARDAEGAAFMPELLTLESAGQVIFHFDGGNPDAGSERPVSESRS